LSRRIPGSRTASAAAWLFGAPYLALTLGPAAAAFVYAFTAGGEAGDLLLGWREAGLMANSAGATAGTVLVAAALGIPYGFALHLRPPFRRCLAVLGAASFLIPPYVLAIAWIDLLGHSGVLGELSRDLLGEGIRLPHVYGLVGVSFVQGTALFPLMAGAVLLGASQCDARLVESIRLWRGRAAAFIYGVLPMAGPTMLAGAALVAMLALASYNVPALLQVNTYPVAIYSQFSAFHDIPAAIARAVPLLLAGALLTFGLAWSSGARRPWLTGRRTPWRPRVRPALRWAAAVFCLAAAGASALLPLAVLFARSRPFSVFGEVWKTASEELAASVLIAAPSAALAAVLALGLAVASGEAPRMRRAARLGLAGFLVSGPVTAIGLIFILNRPMQPFSAVYDSLWVVAAACVGRFAFFAFRAMEAALRGVDRGLTEAAAICGVSAGRRLLGVTAPLALPAAAAAWCVLFVLCFREVDASSMIYPPGMTPASVRLYTLMHYGPSQYVSALALLMALASLAGGLAAAGAYRALRKVLWHEH
jgi:iron(III) transport system permease protein